MGKSTKLSINLLSYVDGLYFVNIYCVSFYESESLSSLCVLGKPVSQMEYSDRCPLYIRRGNPCLYQELSDYWTLYLMFLIVMGVRCYFYHSLFLSFYLVIVSA